MSTRIPSLFGVLKESNRCGFIVYLTAGDPTLEDTVDLVLRLEKAGVDLVELGIPFSDPLADGPVNQAAAERALSSGATLDRILEGIRCIRAQSEVPLVLYSYLNPLLARGFDDTLSHIAEAGADGILALDLTAEEAGPFRPSFIRHGIEPICLVTPTSTDARIRRICRDAGGFVYCVSREGVTGVQSALSGGAPELIRRTRAHTSLPLALGFGISSAKQVHQAALHADAVVVGSALVDRFHKAGRSGRAAVLRWAGALARAAHETQRKSL